MNQINTEPISGNAEIFQRLSCLPEKFVVDFANGIDVVRDHTRTQKSRTGFFQRLYDGFSGQGTKRQHEVNASLADGVEASLKWLNELSTSLAKTNYSIVQVNQRVAMIQDALTTVANYSADTREQLIELSHNLGRRCNALEEEMNRIDMVQRANDHMDLVFTRWQAGRFHALSPSGRCYAALEELWWGNFGDFYRQSTASARAGHVERLTNRAIVQMAEDANTNPTARNSAKEWLLCPNANTSDTAPDMVQALEYLGDWAIADHQPFVYSVSSLTAHAELPLTMPRICSATRIGEALVNEVFERRQ